MRAPDRQTQVLPLGPREEQRWARRRQLPHSRVIHWPSSYPPWLCAGLSVFLHIAPCFGRAPWPSLVAVSWHSPLPAPYTHHDLREDLSRLLGGVVLGWTARAILSFPFHLALSLAALYLITQPSFSIFTLVSLYLTLGPALLSQELGWSAYKRKSQNNSR